MKPWLIGSTAALGAACVSFSIWLSLLPRLDPTGREDSSAAVMAMINDKPVLNVSTGWPMTKTGWPFFGRYGGESK